jgi:hypothetical protein
MGSNINWEKDKARRFVTYRESETDKQSALHKAGTAWLKANGDPSRKNSRLVECRDIHGKRVLLDPSELARANRKTRHKHHKRPKKGVKRIKRPWHHS